jgi:hypothetical protein
MIGAISLAFIMLGSILYPKIFKDKTPAKPVRKTRATTKKPVARKPAAKKPATRTTRK